MKTPTSALILRDQDDRVDGEGLVHWLFVNEPPAVATPHFGPFPLEPAARRGWWRIPVPFDPDADDIDLVSKPGRRMTGYRRTREVEGYPETMTVVQYQATVDDDEGEGDPIARVIYEPEYEATPPIRTPLGRDWVVLDGAPPPDDGLTWESTLPAALRYHDEFGHLFPGALVGFREALASALDEIDGVKAYARSGVPHVTVYLRVELPRLEPVEWLKPPNYAGMTGAEKRRARERLSRAREEVTRSLEVPAPSSIPGQNRAEARAAWDERIHGVLDIVRSIVGSPCPTCKGRGFVEGGVRADA